MPFHFPRLITPHPASQQTRKSESKGTRKTSKPLSEKIVRLKIDPFFINPSFCIRIGTMVGFHDHCDFVAFRKLGTFNTIRPDFVRQKALIH